MENYLSQEELKSFQEMKSELYRMKMTIGELEMQKVNIMMNVDHIQTELKKKESDIIDKYGPDTIINVSTGEITKKEK